MIRLRSLLVILLLTILATLASVALPASAQGSTASGPDLAQYPILFKRADAPQQPKDAIQLVMVGDTSMARGVESVTNQNGLDYPFEKVGSWLRAADLAIGNYEGVIAAEGVGHARALGYRLRAKPAAASALASAGFDLFTLANNHSVDYGINSLKVTKENLEIAGLKTVGAGPNATEARKPVVVEVDGIKIVFLAYTMVPDPPDGDRDTERTWTRSWFGPTFAHEKLADYVKAALPLGDLVIVQFHWGNEYIACPQSWQIDLGKAAINAGAALVVGHHPHVVQPYEKFGKGFIAYSLGNFVFDQDIETALALWIRLDKKGVIDVHGLGVHPGVRPDWYSPVATKDLLSHLCRFSDARSTAYEYSSGKYVAQPAPTDFSGESGANRCEDHPLTIRQIGQVDLQGDTKPEQVTLQDGRLRIYENQGEVYESHSSWRVVDAAIGDPNQDGRFEVMMLIWKQDTPNGPVTTHPFLLGYRGGAYKVIWGGSATSEWMQAVGVADLDGDLLDEFVTIERDPGALACEARYRVMVSKWNGWGFTRQWASEFGYFTRLKIATRRANSLPTVIAQ
jgi:poly-gamma-glutamate capsule biosynthesis protein CapA/YwtB (metallophosphatase superfamily)